MDDNNLEAWQTLVHVCQRWRSVVFGAPRRLNLRLVFSANTPARDTLDVWPALPLLIQCYQGLKNASLDNIVAVLERSNRVREIVLNGISSSYFEKLSATMQEPFPKLRHLELSLYKETVPVLPDPFLGGSAPRLRFLYLRGIPSPGLPKLLLSTIHLATLRLYDIPHSGYISPGAIAIALSKLTRLGILQLEFQSPRYCPDLTSRRPPPPTRFILPALKRFSFKGVSEYLEDLVAHIDAPRLFQFHITFFNQIVFDTPQLIQFISRTSALKSPEKARLIFEKNAARVTLRASGYGLGELKVKILCRELDWQVSSLEQVCTVCLPSFSTLEDLYISEHPNWHPVRQDNIENMLWLELLQPFTTVKNFYLSEKFASSIVVSLKELVGGGMTEVLPTLQNIFLEGLQTSGPVVQEGIRQFVATRQTSHPILVSCWDTLLDSF